MTEDLPDELETIATGIDPAVWIVIGVVAAVLIVGILIAVFRRRRRTARYQARFGREYERTVERAGSRSAAERELDERAERRQRFTLQPLSASRRDELRARWDHLQSDFVDAPASTVRNAEVLLDEAAREHGYPDADSEQRLRDLALDHSDEVHAYREATGTVDRDADGTASDDEGSLRRRMVAGRDLFEAVLESSRTTTDLGADHPTGGSSPRRSVADPGATDPGEADPHRRVADVGEDDRAQRPTERPPRAETRAVPPAER